MILLLLFSRIIEGGPLASGHCIERAIDRREWVLLLLVWAMGSSAVSQSNARHNSSFWLVVVVGVQAYITTHGLGRRQEKYGIPCAFTLVPPMTLLLLVSINIACGALSGGDLWARFRMCLC